MTMQVQKGTDNKILRTVSEPVGSITGELRNFVLDMVKTMEQEEGVGLAAPQVGRNIRLIVCKLNPGDKNEIIVPMVNPLLLQVSEDQVDGEEGCLSLPETWGNVLRARTVLVRYKNLKDQDVTLELSDFNARIVQHEIDHLEGILFVDKANNIHENVVDEAAHI